MPYRISVIEIALLIVFPLILFYQRSRLTNKQSILYISWLYLAWFFSYACIHELSHMFGSWITGAKISDYQLIPPFWKGDFKTAYVNSVFENKIQTGVSLIMPYFRDIGFLITGLWLVKRKRTSNHFLSGLILILFILSPLYDILNNYSGFILRSSGDFKALSMNFGNEYAHALGLLFSITAVLFTLKIIVVFKSYPVLSIKK